MKATAKSIKRQVEVQKVRTNLAKYFVSFIESFSNWHLTGHPSWCSKQGSRNSAFSFVACMARILEHDGGIGYIHGPANQEDEEQSLSANSTVTQSISNLKPWHVMSLSSIWRRYSTQVFFSKDVCGTGNSTSSAEFGLAPAIDLAASHASLIWAEPERTYEHKLQSDKLGTKNGEKRSLSAQKHIGFKQTIYQRIYISYHILSPIGGGKPRIYHVW